MRQQFRSRSWRGGAAVLLLVVVGPASAQILPSDGEENFRKAFNNDRKLSSDLLKLQRGTLQAGPEFQEAIDMQAKWYTYRFTWPQVQNTPGKVDEVHRQFRGELDNALSDKARGANQQYVAMLTKQLLVRADEVLQNDKPIARINVARLLAVLAQTGQESIGTSLVKALEDSGQNDGVRYWVLIGLGELIKATYGQNPPAPFKSKDIEARCVKALGDFILRPITFLSEEEKEGLRSLRREAVRALAQFHLPATADDKKSLRDPVALVLLKVLGKDGLTPEPRLDEQVEAAVGVATLRCKAFDGYQPDYAAHHLGAFVVEFGGLFNDNRDRGGWKYHAARMTEALAGPYGMKQDVATTLKDKEMVKYVDEVIKQALAVLTPVEKGAATTAPADFGTWLANNPPKSETVYKNVPDAKLNPPKPAAEGENK